MPFSLSLSSTFFLFWMIKFSCKISFHLLDWSINLFSKACLTNRKSLKFNLYYINQRLDKSWSFMIDVPVHSACKFRVIVVQVQYLNNLFMIDRSYIIYLTWIKSLSIKDKSQSDIVIIISAWYQFTSLYTDPECRLVIRQVITSSLQLPLYQIFCANIDPIKTLFYLFNYLPTLLFHLHLY